MRVIRLDTVDSTNTYLHAYRGDEDVVVVTARHQTAGRGQGGNRWEDAEGQNLLFSIQIRPVKVAISHQFVLAMAEALELKWPNDIYHRDRKLSGTLIETAVSGGRLKRMILGTGINVNQRRFTSDAPNPVALSQITGSDESIDHLLERILQAFDDYYRRVLEGDYAGISREYHEALYRRKGFYRYRDGEFDAELVGVAYDGRLSLRDSEGRQRSYAFKEVEFII